LNPRTWVLKGSALPLDHQSCLPESCAIDNSTSCKKKNDLSTLKQNSVVNGNAKWEGISCTVQYSDIIYVFLAKSSDTVRGDASPSSYQENSQAATLERLKDSIQEYLSKQDAMSKIQVFWPHFFL
jgi:hypothetical protein